MKLTISIYRQMLHDMREMKDFEVQHTTISTILNEKIYNQLEEMDTNSLAIVLALTKRHFTQTYFYWAEKLKDKDLFIKYMEKAYGDSWGDDSVSGLDMVEIEKAYLNSIPEFSDYETFAISYSKVFDITKDYM